MITIIKTSKTTISRYQEQSIISAIENLSKQDKQLDLFFPNEEKRYFKNLKNGVLTWDKKLKYNMESIIGFTVKTIHFPTIKTVFSKYNINIQFPKRISRKQKVNQSIINQDHNHFYGRM